MKFTSAILGVCSFTGALARPSVESRDSVQTVHLTFHGGPASYTMAFPADGKVRATHKGISVNIIDAPDYNAFQQCQFKTKGDKTLVQSIGDGGLQQIVVGPPQPIISVSCKGMCVPTYGECYKNNQYVGPCCNGFCAADRCRPWDISTS
ncbi:hypothetical protein AK830_g7924 [Neonectria ditissima]|uniref:Uncharacterized protein n=1 Tax=Neonectria ditissima TaxID=78410 RepID=A0A0P7AVW4_9HYPO|nr:hypothetical protein AK830_g7924 [Neonectria ditissima]